MSLISILSNMAGNSGSTSSSIISATQARLVIAQASREKASSTPSPTTSISASALLAQANKTDRAKDFSTVAKETRTWLDTPHGSAGGKKDADLGAVSGRALASIILNEGGQFTQKEQAAARGEMKSRERDVLTAALSSGTSVATLASYGKTLASNYDATSPEERRVLGYTPQTRLNAARMASTSSVSLFDQLD